MKRAAQQKASLITNFSLVTSSTLCGLAIIAGFDFLYSKIIQENFTTKSARSESQKLYRQSQGGWYELNPEYRGHDHYGKLSFVVHTDKNGFRVSPPAAQQESAPKTKQTIAIIGDSFTYGVGTEWSETFSAKLAQISGANVLNLGVNSHSPTPHVYRLKKLLASNKIPPTAIILMAVDVSDVQDEATRWRDTASTPVDISTQIPVRAVSTQNKQQAPFFSVENFKLSHQIYYALESIVKHYIDNIQVRNLDRSAFTHRDWDELAKTYEPIGVKGGLRRIASKIEEAAKLSAKHGHKFYLLIYPWPAQIAYENKFNWAQAISSYCQRPYCSGTVNTIPLFQSLSKQNKDWQNTYYIRGDMHFNANGNAVIANAIYRQLLDPTN